MMTENSISEAAETGLERADTISLAVAVVAAFVANNPLPAAELGPLLASVHQAFGRLLSGAAPVADKFEGIEKPTAAQVRKSITPDAIISFIDGKAYKTMKRHLGVHGFDPRSYRERYGLPNDYPMVASSYAAHRSALAKSIGLGSLRSLAESEGNERGVARSTKSRASTAA